MSSFKLLTPVILMIQVVFLASCKKESAKDNATDRSRSSAAKPLKSSAAVAPSLNRRSAVVLPAQPVPYQEDEGAQPGVWLSINDLANPEIPQGWPITIRATVLPGRDKPIQFNTDDVALRVTDVAGANAAWPVKRITPAQTFKVGQPGSASIMWIVSDSKSIRTGAYHLSVKLTGAVEHDALVAVVPLPANLTEQQQDERFVLKGRSDIASGDAQSALQQSEARLAARPRDILALHLKADALAALGRREEAAAAYNEALVQFSVQNPNSPEPPIALINGLRAVQPTQQ